MISWIQRYFQHHFKTVFAVLLVLIIISFVFITNASGGFGRGDHNRIVDRPFLDYNLSLPEDQARVFGDAQISATLRIGAFGGLDQERLERYAFARATSLHFAKLWHIPAATTAEIAEEIKKLGMFTGQDGQFDQKAYTTFRDNLKTQPRGVGMTEADIARVLGDDVRADKVQKLLAGPGYVLPADIKSQLQRFETTYTIATATVDFAAFKVDLKPADAELTQFFEQAGGRYDVPPRVVVNYVEFPSSAFVGNVTVTDAEVRAYYDQNPSRFPKPAVVKPADAAATPPKVDPEADFALVRSAAEASLKLERAQKLAVKAGSDLAVQVFETFKKKQPEPAALESFLTARSLQLKSAPPFTGEAVPAVFGGSPDVGEAAFRLGPQDFASSALPTPAGAAVLFWKDTQPSRKPLFTEVREKVLADYLDNERRKRFVDLGRSLKTQLEARLKAGDPLEKAAAAVTGAKLEAKTIAPFSLRTRPQDLDTSVLGSLERLEKGQLSDMVISNAEKGIFVYVMDRKAPVLDESNPRYVEARTQLSARVASFAGQALLGELVEKEKKKSEPKL